MLMVAGGTGGQAGTEGTGEPGAEGGAAFTARRAPADGRQPGRARAGSRGGEVRDGGRRRARLREVLVVVLVLVVLLLLVVLVVVVAGAEVPSRPLPAGTGKAKPHLSTEVLSRHLLLLLLLPQRPRPPSCPLP